MKIYIYIIFLFSFINIAQTQYWEKINTLPPSFRDGYYLDIYFLPNDSNYVWACGFDGFVVRSTNYGLTWQGSVVPQPAYHLENIQFVSNSVGFVSGVEGIWKSTDGGASFTDITPVDSSGRGFWGCYFLDANLGVVLGGGCDDLQRFYKTTNGGASWSLFTTQVPGTGLTDLILYNDGTGFAVSSGYLWITSNSGSTWTIFKDTGNEIWQEEISRKVNSFLLPMAGSICSGGGGGGGMNFSTDAGNNWTKYNTTYPIFGAYLTSETSGWACGYGRSVFHTSNSGQTWQLRNCGIPNVDLDDITFLSQDEGWVCGNGIYKLVPTKILASKDSIGFGEICFPDTRKDSLKVINLSFFPADLQVQIINDFGNAFKLISPDFNSQIFNCDSNGVVVQFAPLSNDIYTAKLRISAISGDGKTSFIKEIPLVGTGNKSTIKSENKTMVFDSIPCNIPKTVDLKWFSDNYNEQLKSVFELKDDKNQITFQTNLPVWVTKTGATTQFQLLLKDTGWVSQDYRFILLPCNTDTIITISAYGVSPIINSLDSLHFISRCNGDILDTIPVWNTGNASLTISKASIVGNPPEVQIIGWTSKKNYPLNIPINKSDSIIIRFTPQLLSNTSYYLKLDNDDLTLTRGNKNPLNVLLLGRKESELIKIKDSVIDFSKICISKVKDTIITFENIGNISGLVKLENKTKLPFSANLPWNFTINSKEKGSFSLRFSPTEIGQFYDTLIFKTGDCNYLRLYLKGIGIESKIESSPTNILGTLKSGESKNYSILLKNSGNTVLNITNYRFNPPTSDFSFELLPALSQTLDINQQIEFVLKALSNKNAFYKGQICFQVQSDCPLEICIPVEFISISRYLSIVDSLNFGINKCSSIEYDTIWVKNAGAVPDTIDSYDLSGSTEFKLTEVINSITSIPSGDSVGFVIKFSALIEGKYSAVLTVNSKNPDGQTLITQINAEFKKTDFILSTNNINFGTFEKCDKDTTITIEITNNGTLSDQLLAFGYTISDGFEINDYSPIYLEGNSKYFLNIKFSPSKTSASGIITNYISWYSSTCNDSLKLNFQANIIDPKLNYSSKELDFGSVWINDTKQDVIVATNNSEVTRTIKSIKSLSNQSFVLVSSLPIILNPTETKEIIFKFSPLQQGNYSDTLIIEESSSCSDTLMLSLVGSSPFEEYSATITAGNYNAFPGDTIFVEFTLTPNLDRIFPDLISFRINFDKHLIYPVQLLYQSTLGNYSNHYYEYSSGSLTTLFSKEESNSILTNSNKVILLKAVIMASMPNFTPIRIEQFEVTTQKKLSITKVDGSLTIPPGCAPELENHIIIYPKPNMTILENKNSEGSILIKFENIQQGQTLSIYNLLGVPIKSIILDKGSYEREIELTNFSQGIYFFALNNSNLTPRKLILLGK